MKKIAYYISAAALSALFASETQAATVKCIKHTSFTGEDAVVNLSSVAPISNGADLPVGTVLYTGSYKALKPSGVYCNGSPENKSFTLTPILKSEFSSSPPAISSLTHNGHTVYQTNVAGVGVVVTGYAYNKPLPSSHDWSSVKTSGAIANGLPQEYSLILLKTGPIASGIVNANQFPKMKATFIGVSASTPIPSGDVVTGFPIAMGSLRFTGAIRIANSTCNVSAPDIVIPLGKYEVSSFTGKGFTTDWVKSNINLSGCSNFSNNYYAGARDGSKVVGTGNMGPGTPSKVNHIYLKVSPVGTLWNQSLGVINLTSSANSASGVGIQLGYGEESKVLAINSENLLAQPKGTNYSIPIAARYYQTESKVTPGIANGKVTYTIAYK